VSLVMFAVGWMMRGEHRKWVMISAGLFVVLHLSAFVWFVPGSFPAQAYLVLAFLGMSATEFVARCAYRPAYFTHAAASLFPLVALLIIQGGLYAQMTAVLVIFFAGALYTQSGRVARLLEESILLRDANTRLIGRLSQEKRTVEESLAAAQASERSKSTFISTISHEIRTPLNAIVGMAQVLERDDELNRSARDHAKVLLEAGRGLRLLLDDIIALAQNGEDSPERAPDDGCDAGQVARTVGRLLQPNAWEKRLRLSVNIASGLPRAAVNPRVLRRVLLKLAGNAIKFTERGNVEIAVDFAEGKDGGPLVRIRVTDTGPGIPGHLIGSIFEPFTKADDSYARRYNGAGVGLSVAKRLVESAGGAIGVSSEPGTGASFWVTIPAVRGVSGSGLDSAEPATPPSGLSVLALIPDKGVRDSLDHLLSPFGNRIVFAENLADAVRNSTRGGFSLLVAQAAEVDALAAMPGQTTPILALASFSDRQPDGADGMLRWPATAGSLYAAISALTGSQSGNGARRDAENDDGIIDAKAFAELEKSIGLKTLIDILQSYITTSEELTKALSSALGKEEWTGAGRLAQDIAGAAGGLGLTALTTAARLLAQGARDDWDQSTLKDAASEVLNQHKRTRDALCRLYPDLAA